MRTDDRKWIRLQSKGRCPECGLTKPHLYQLIREGRIRSACLRAPGKKTGVRLIWLPSILDLIEANTEPAGPKGGAQ